MATSVLVMRGMSQRLGVTEPVSITKGVFLDETFATFELTLLLSPLARILRIRVCPRFLVMNKNYIGYLK
ncbi:hypothetical protein [Variovorax paradoxus]|uniref:hypothetical protein n=1 Tax=Variovorax paradoxus TaxID=34073 RepID=UPI0012D3BC0D|nr:hypothetical protein [Variovorax paradoxus]